MGCSQFICVSGIVCSSPPKVYKVSFWMGAYKSPTPKRTTLWSSSSMIRGFWSRAFSLKTFRAERQKKKNELVKPVRYYKDASGRKCFTGTAELKDTQQLSYRP